MARPIKAKELAARALPYIEGFDLMGTGPTPSRKECDEINSLLHDIYELLGTSPDERTSF